MPTQLPDEVLKKQPNGHEPMRRFKAYTLNELFRDVEKRVKNGGKIFGVHTSVDRTVFYMLNKDGTYVACYVDTNTNGTQG